MRAINRVLVPTDFSESSVAALDHARALCRQLHADLVLLHVVETRGFTNVIASSGYAGLIPDLFEEILEGERARLESLVSDEDRGAFHATAVTRIGGRPGRDIVDFAVETRADLIVMGTHARRGLSHLVLGSVAEEVIRLASCPVLTVRHSPRDMECADTSARTAAAGTA